jgi:hypothetical protein
MFRRIACGTLLCALAALAGACGSTTTPTTPTPIAVTDTFTGTLLPSGANIHAFGTLTGGPVVAKLTTVGPDPAVTIGFSLGTFNSTLGVCTVILDNPAGLQGAVLNATASTTGAYCMRLYDNGNIAAAATAGTAQSFSYTVTVLHP